MPFDMMPGGKPATRTVVICEHRSNHHDHMTSAPQMPAEKAKPQKAKPLRRMKRSNDILEALIGKQECLKVGLMVSFSMYISHLLCVTV